MVAYPRLVARFTTGRLVKPATSTELSTGAQCSCLSSRHHQQGVDCFSDLVASEGLSTVQKVTVLILEEHHFRLFYPPSSHDCKMSVLSTLLWNLPPTKRNCLQVYCRFRYPCSTQGFTPETTEAAVCIESYPYIAPESSTVNLTMICSTRGTFMKDSQSCDTLLLHHTNSVRIDSMLAALYDAWSGRTTSAKRGH